MKFHTLFAAAVGPLAASFTPVTAIDSGNATEDATNTGTLIPDSTSTLTSNENDASPSNTPISSNSSTSDPHCDALYAHRLIYISGYNAAKEGFGTVLNAYDAFDWCFNDTDIKFWCPGVISLTTTRIASQVKSDLTAEYDYNNINNLTLLSTVVIANARSRRFAISEARSLLESSGLTSSKENITLLKKERWLMAQQEEPIDYDADEFDELMASQDGEGLEKRWFVGPSDFDRWPVREGPIPKVETCAGNPLLCRRLHWTRRLRFGSRYLLDKIKSRLFKSGTEPIFHEAELAEAAGDRAYWEMKDGPVRAQRWVDRVPDDFEEVPQDALQRGIVDPIERPDVPLHSGQNVVDDVPFDWEGERLTHSPPVQPRPKYEKMRVFRTEEFDQATGLMKQLTVTQILDFKISQTPQHMLQQGLKPFHVLDAAGEIMPGEPKWLGKKHLTEVAANERWVSLGTARIKGLLRQWVDEEAERLELQVNSLGELLVFSANGVALNLVPVVAQAGAAAGAAGAAAGAGVGAVDGALEGLGAAVGTIFDIFKPEGGKVEGDKPEDSRITFDPKSGKVNGHDLNALPKGAPGDIEDQQNHGEETEDESQQSKPNASKQPADPDKDDKENSEDQKDDSKQPTDPDKDDKDSSEGQESDNSEGEETKTAETTAHEPTTASKPATTARPTTNPKPTAAHETIPPGGMGPEPNKATATSKIGTPSAHAPANEQHQMTSNPYPYDNSHLSVTLLDPPKAHDTAEATKTHTSSTSSDPDKHPRPTSNQETIDDITSAILPFPNSNIPKKFPGPTKAHDATEAMKTHTSDIYPYPDNHKPTPSNIDPYQDNFGPKTSTKSNPYPYPDKHTPTTQTTKSNPYPYPDKQTPTTLVTTTKSDKSKTTTATGAWPAVTTITGCKTNKDCPVCNAETSCRIGDLPPECVRNAMNINNMSVAGNYTWDFCVDQIKMLDRQRAKAWAVAISLPYCVSDDEWKPKDVDREHGGECWIDVRGDEFVKVRDVYIGGLMPLKCPSKWDVGTGYWKGYDKDFVNDCKRVGKVLSSPFRDH